MLGHRGVNLRHQSVHLVVGRKVGVRRRDFARSQTHHSLLLVPAQLFFVLPLALLHRLHKAHARTRLVAVGILHGFLLLPVDLFLDIFLVCLPEVLSCRAHEAWVERWVLIRLSLNRVHEGLASRSETVLHNAVASRGWD